MGLFDMFGAGGGTLTLAPQSTQVAAGQMLGGTVTFTGGKRSQNVTTIKVRVVCEQRPVGRPGEPPPAPQSRDVVPEQIVSGPFQTQPGTPHAFQFQFQLPPQLAAEVRGQIDYKLTASVDIPGEPDAHAVADLQLLGGVPGGAGMGMGAPMMGGMGMGGMGMGGAPMHKPMIGIGTHVSAAHPMGGWHPGKIVAEQNGMFGVDWDDTKLGSSTWVSAQQVQASAGGMDPMGGMPPMPMPLSIGTPVDAQHPNGGWHRAQIVAMQNGMIGVDWADPMLGSSTWLQANQVQAGK